MTKHQAGYQKHSNKWDKTTVPLPEVPHPPASSMGSIRNESPTFTVRFEEGRVWYFTRGNTESKSYQYNPKLCTQQLLQFASPTPTNGTRCRVTAPDGTLVNRVFLSTRTFRHGLILTKEEEVKQLRKIHTKMPDLGWSLNSPSRDVPTWPDTETKELLQNVNDWSQFLTSEATDRMKSFFSRSHADEKAFCSHRLETHRIRLIFGIAAAELRLTWDDYTPAIQ